MKYIFLPLLLLLSLSLHAQQPEIVKGDLLIQVADEKALLQIIDELQQLNGQPTRLHIGRQLSPIMGIWQLHFDYSRHSHEQMLEKLQMHPACRAAQLNRVLKKRVTTPNDPNFGQQWQYINNGASGGVVDADIDADLAWDITTGGLTALGDTIVACIIDDGLDLSHADMAANRWYNWNEIPNNGIDDDNNGYVDDYRGWDAYDADDDISGGTIGGGHGTPVAGIVGAKGNNGIGVSGVNWNVKLMIVVGGGDEAQAIAGYNYPLVMRRLYNQTAGQRGAFVVCTNASWGVDNALASSAPLWCAMYDTLGAVGILNAGATANANTNVDVQGDLPTHCPSDYLVAVTNMSRADQKITSAGYGLLSVDLGAPGESAYTVAKPNSYAAFGGTSGATPHVAGTIALLYSVPCPRLALRARTDPAATAALMKSFILQGVDTLPGLQGITVSGGRLNLNKTLLLAMQSGCALSGCYQPFGLTSNNISDSSALLAWVGVPDATMGYLLRYREVGSSTWIDMMTTDTFLNISGLAACTNYEWQLAGDCDTTISSFSNIYSFRTANCCLAPTSINIDSIGTNLASFSWNLDANVISYTLEYRVEGDTVWMALNTNLNSFSLNNLDSCTNYELRIISTCAVNINNNYSQIITFRTRGCGNCIDLNYCAALGDDSSYEWITSVALNNLLSTSGDDNGYGDYTNRSTDLYRGHGFSIDLDMNTAPSPSPNWRWKVWIDYNQDGTFDNTTELVYNSGAITTVTLSANGNIQIPTAIPVGSTRMRVGMKWGSSDFTACTNFSYGEVEDYCVNIMDDPSALTIAPAAPQLFAYPNPSNDLLNISYGTGEDVFYTIYDLTGRSLKTGLIKNGFEQVDISLLNAGMYILKLDANKGQVKVVKN